MAHEDGAIERLKRMRDAFSQRDKERASRNPVVEGKGMHGGTGRRQSAGQMARTLAFVPGSQVDDRPHPGPDNMVHVGG